MRWRTHSPRSSVPSRIRERVAVAMSGGVDSAVALLRAGEHAIGVTLRLWTDPAGPDGERACCSPRAVIAARETCHRRGLPHVTLDMREEFRRAIVAPFVRGYARGETPNPCIALQRDLPLRRAARVRRARRSRAPRHGPLRANRPSPRTAPARRAADPTKDQSYMLARSIRASSSDCGFRSGRRRRTRRAPRPSAPASPRRAAREPGGLLPRRRRLPRLPRPARPRRRARPDRRRGRTRARHARRLLALHARPAPRSRRRGAGAAVRAADRCCDEHSRHRTRDALATNSVNARGRLYADVERVEAKLRYRSRAAPATVTTHDAGFRPRPRRARVRRRARPGGRALRGRRRGRRRSVIA